MTVACMILCPDVFYVQVIYAAGKCLVKPSPPEDPLHGDSHLATNNLISSKQQGKKYTQ